jgi:hypothetical protein
MTAMSIESREVFKDVAAAKDDKSLYDCTSDSCRFAGSSPLIVFQLVFLTVSVL